MNIDLNYFPGWVRKSITFTIDDGNTVLDRKFMNYVKPAGITGTFNLKTPLKSELGADGYRELYRGYEIATPSLTGRPPTLRLSIRLKRREFSAYTPTPGAGSPTAKDISSA